MAYKKTCPTLAKIADNEPMFVLRAQDRSAPALVQAWIAMNPQISKERREEAYKCADLMAAWPHRKAAD